MKRDYRDENFEEFIKRNADNLRMKAPERVWQNLSGELEKGRRRFSIGLSAFFLVASVLGYLTISTTKYPLRTTGQPFSNQQDLPAAEPVNNTTGGRLTIATQNGITATLNLKAVVPQQQLAYGSMPLASAESGTTEQLPEGNNLIAQDDFTPTVVDAHSPVEVAAPAESNERQIVSATTPGHTSPWTIESATNLYLQKSKRKEKRLQTQFHFSPTISYRKLSENKSYLRHTTSSPSSSPSLGSYNVLSSNVNSMVTHKPDIGFEVGVAEKYSVSQNVRLRAGLQFNVNRYDIKAFQSPYALTTIALNNRRTASVDSVWAIANYSNVGGNQNNRGSWLQNYSFQVSAPIGVELALKGNDKMQFGIATSVQPTYVLGDRAYLITSDYKSYTQVPWLLRRWNVNTAFEAFVQYQTGRTRWQVGPHVRYQLLSSFVTNYPVKENLFDFGLKVGVSVIK